MKEKSGKIFEKEKQYTSTSNKLLNHIDRLDLIRKHNQWHPISLQIAPTEICNLKCEYCSVKNKGKQVLPFSWLRQAIDKFEDVGIKSLEISGGGEPTLYPAINNLILYGIKKGLQIGLITNGISLDNIKKEVLEQLTWLRISLSALDFGIDVKIPEVISPTLGLSYVWNRKSDLKILEKLNQYALNPKIEYIRIVPNCLDYKEQTQLKEKVKVLLDKTKISPKIFIQTKEYSIYPNCWIGGLKPLLYADGFVYQCSACALYERKFTAKWRICHLRYIKKIWPNNYKQFDNSMCEKGKCFYYEHNKLLDEVQMRVKHNGFI